VTGVNWEADLMILKFLGPKGGYTSDAVEALNYAVDNGAPISNNSWGGGGKSQALQDAISDAEREGHLFVAAAGNAGNDNDVTPSYPASYTNPNIISVAATDDDDGLASFSNFGVQSVDLGAPGVGILSTVPGGYARYSGTSMASPHVAGVAALIKSQNPVSAMRS
jgi:thermitase